MESYTKNLKQFWSLYKRNHAAVIGLLLVLFYVAVAAAAPILAPIDPFTTGPSSFAPPSDQFPMGTDDLGRDIYSGVLHGARISLSIGFIAATISYLVGVIVGAFSGYYGGKVDDILMRITEAFQVIPVLVLALVIITLFQPTLWNIAFTIGILAWPGTARLVRAEFLSLKQQEFVEAARSIGYSNMKIVFQEILPNAIPPAIVNTSLQVANAILLEAGLGFLGLSDPNVMSWGFLLRNAQRFLRHGWWLSVFPGVSISLVVIGLNLVGDGLNDALNPRLKQR